MDVEPPVQGPAQVPEEKAAAMGGEFTRAVNELAGDITCVVHVTHVNVTRQLIDSSSELTDYW